MFQPTAETPFTCRLEHHMFRPAAETAHFLGFRRRLEHVMFQTRKKGRLRDPSSCSDPPTGSGPALREHVHVRHLGRIAVMDEPDLTAAVRADEVIALLHLDPGVAMGRMYRIHASTVGIQPSRPARTVPNQRCQPYCIGPTP